MTGPVDARHEHAHPWRATFTLLLPALWSFIALILALATLAGAAVALLRGERGTAWLLTNLPGVEARGVTGALLGERFGVEHLSFSVRPGLERLTLEGVQAEGMRWTWRPPARGWVGVQVATLSARRVVILTGKGSGQAPVLPESLRLPLAADFDHVTVGELHIDRLSPILDIQAQGALSALNGTQHRVDELRFRWDRIAVSAAGDVGTAAPFALSAQIDVAPAQADAPPWGGRALVRGPLEALDVRGRLRGSPQAGQEAPWLDVVATVRPLDPWPLNRLEGRTEGLDLSTLASGLPRTRLDGEASVNARTLDAPVQATLNITNGVPGRWDRGSLPVAALNLDIDLDLRRPDQAQIGRFELQLAGDGGSAGRASGTGRWEGDTLKLDARVDDLRPQRLHGQAPGTRVSGPLTFTLRGLPVGRASAAASAPGNTPQPPGLGFDLQGTLQGTLDAAPQPVTLTFDLGWTPDRLQLSTLSAQAGNARAEAMAVLTRQGRRWQLSTRGVLDDVEPQVWWPGPEDSAWRRGPHRLSADWALGLLLPANAEELLRTAPLQLLQTLVGTGQLRLRPSLLAGVPVSGEVLMAQRAALGGNAAPPVSPQATTAPSRVQADLRVGSNRLTLQGEGDPLGTGQDDQTTVTLQAPALRELAPLAALLPVLAPWAPRSGDVQAQVTVQGRWPDARSDGTARLAGVQVGSLALRDGNARWALDTRSEAPLDLTLALNDLTWDRQRLQALALTLQGTPRAHQLQLQADVPQVPPLWVETLFGQRAGPGTRATLQAEGGWRRDALGGGGLWSGRLRSLQVTGQARAAGAGSAAPVASPGATPSAVARWLDARDLPLEVHFTPAGGLDELRAGAGSAQLAQHVMVRWDAVRLLLAGPRPDWTLRARLEPFAVAPLLARVQPGMGWGGDLLLAGKLDLQVEDRLRADVTFERASGDLTIDDAAGRTPLGLQAARLSLQAADGQWTFEQALSGRILGDIRGRQVMRIDPAQRWPDRNAPLEGELEARVGSLGIWSAWVPPGWRLAGSLNTRLTLGGRVGSPALTGRLDGRDIAVRNPLQGVDVSNGEVAITLAGDTARIETFTLRGGEGTVRVTGDARLGERPEARLAVTAERFRALGRIDRRLVVGGEGQLRLDAERLVLDGKLRVDEGVFDVSRRDAPSLDEDVVMRGAGLPEVTPEEVEAARTNRRRNQVNLDIDLGKNLSVRGRGLDARLTGQVRVSTTAAGRLALNGVVQTEGGTYAAYGQRLEIERGRLTFTGATDNPAMDILALRPNIDQRVGVAITGNFANPRVRLFADPDLSETDKLSWLVLGRPSDGLGRADTALLQRAAVALLAGEGEAPTDTLMRTLGLDEFSLRQGETDERETVVTLGKQLSRRWYVGYERGVNAATGTWQLIYRIAQRFTLRAQSGEDSALDIIWVWRVGENSPLPVSLPTTLPGLGGVRKSAPAGSPPASAPAPAGAPRAAAPTTPP